MELEYLVIRMRILLGTYCFCYYVDDEKKSKITKTITTFFKIGKRNGGVRKKYTKIRKTRRSSR